MPINKWKYADPVDKIFSFPKIWLDIFAKLYSVSFFFVFIYSCKFFFLNFLVKGYARGFQLQKEFQTK